MRGPYLSVSADSGGYEREVRANWTVTTSGELLHVHIGNDATLVLNRAALDEFIAVLSKAREEVTAKVAAV